MRDRGWLIVIVRLACGDGKLVMALANLTLSALYCRRDGSATCTGMLEHLDLHCAQSMAEFVCNFSQEHIPHLVFIIEVVVRHATVELPYETAVALEA